MTSGPNPASGAKQKDAVQKAVESQARKPAPITAAAVESYLYSLLPERDEVLAEIERQAATRKIPIVGPAVGRLFYQLTQISGAKTIFEMGSAIGYSTLWWARAVGEGGRVIYTDSDSRNAREAQGYFRRAGVAGRIQIEIGDALEILSEQEPNSFDIIFNDVDKEDYPRVFRLAAPRLRRGGLLIADNALWCGKVALPQVEQDQDQDQDEDTRAIREYNRAAYNSPEFFTTILPLRDGVAISRKL